tara:strand:- start:583 stop:843 length:261 start_codon:yes stop_codon:yes gene_type:complete
MTEKRGHDIVAYVLGIVSIVLAFFTPLAGVVLAIVGLVQSKKEKSDLAKKAKKLNIIGLVLSLILFIVSVIVTVVLALNNPIFPVV